MNLNDLIQKYLDTLRVDDWDDYQMTERKFALWQLNKFVYWLNINYPGIALKELTNAGDKHSRLY